MSMVYTAIAISAVAALAGTAFSVYSSQQQGQAAKQISEYNMEIRRREAETKRLVAERNIETQKRKNEADLAKKRLAFGLSGAVASEGSLLESQLQTKEEMAYTEAYMGWQRDVGMDTAVTDLITMDYQGKSAEKAAYTTGVGNLLSGVGKAASVYASYGGSSSSGYSPASPQSPAYISSGLD
jgi:hypothetical protein